MRKIVSLIMISAPCLLAIGCTSGVSGGTGRPSPASEYCVSKGGNLELRKDKYGNEFAICRLPDGSAVEEWEFFRKNNPETPK